MTKRMRAHPRTRARTGTIAIPEHDIESVCFAFGDATFLNDSAAIRILTRIRAECNKIPTIHLFNCVVSRTIKLSDFLRLQADAQKCAIHPSLSFISPVFVSGACRTLRVLLQIRLAAAEALVVRQRAQRDPARVPERARRIVDVS
jgi:hypothetical protein